MTFSSTDRYILRKKLELFEKIKGRHTELISVYVPDGYDINKVAQQIRQEVGTASNIKDKNTRKNVVGALERIDRYLKHFKVTPENGLILFCGNASDKEGVSDIRLWDIFPPEPISIRMYRCDQQFVLEPLKELLEEKEAVGLLVIDKKEATIGLLNGKRIEILKKMASGYHGKFRAGGQSSRRFERLREIAAHEFYVRVGETINKSLIDKKEIKGIIIGGPGSTKDEFIEGSFLHYELQNKILATYDTGYTDESGIKELVNLALTRLNELSIAREKEILRKFLTHVATDDLAIYGKDHVISALNSGAVETLIISEELDFSKVTLECMACGNIEYKDVKDIKEIEQNLNQMPCSKCSEKMLKIVDAKDFVEEYTETAKDVGSNIEMVSSETEEGIQFLTSFGGFGALLRYKISD